VNLQHDLKKQRLDENRSIIRDVLASVSAVYELGFDGLRRTTPLTVAFIQRAMISRSKQKLLGSVYSVRKFEAGTSLFRTKKPAVGKIPINLRVPSRLLLFAPKKTYLAY
jgi:hypothetical protein